MTAQERIAQLKQENVQLRAEFCQISNHILAQKSEFWYADLIILIERGTLINELSLLRRNDDPETNEENQTGVYVNANLLFQLCSALYERSAIIITSNLKFGDWNAVMREEHLTAALLDRLTHRAHILEFLGESFRFRQRLQQAERAGSAIVPMPDGEKAEEAPV